MDVIVLHLSFSLSQVLDAICDKLDKNRADHCKHIVNDYYIPAFEVNFKCNKTKFS